MAFFDSIFYSIHNSSKKRFKQQSNAISVIYITLLQSSIVLLLGAFFAAFMNQMKVNMMSSSKAWILFGITCLILYFKNWVQYTGKKRSVLSAKMTKNKSQHYALWIIILLPIGCIALAILLLKSFL